MSKGTLGTFAGAALGFILTGGNPLGAQIGAMIGGAVGSSFDTIPGRKVGEMTSPRAQEGEPIPLVFGSARVTGRLMSCGEPDIRTESEGGKGGPKVENETAYLSYSILICESSELRDSSINAIQMVIENNKIVWDVRANPAISAADSAKWAANKRFYLGGEDQGVDSTEQMIHGVGNVPAYRGLARMVVTDEDVTQHGGSIPTYEFVTAACGVEPVDVTPSVRFLGTGVTTGPSASARPLSYEMVWQGPTDVFVNGNDTSNVEVVRYGDYMMSLTVQSTSIDTYMRVAPITDLTNWSDGAALAEVTAAGSNSGMIVSGSRLIVYRTINRTIHYLDNPEDVGLTTGPELTGGLFPIAMAGNGTHVLACDANCKLWGSANNATSFAAASSLTGSLETVRNTIDVNGDRFLIAGKTPSSPVLKAYFTDDVGVSTTACTISGAWNTTPHQVLYCGNDHWLIACGNSSPGQSSLFHSSNNGQLFLPVTLPRNLYFDKNSRQNMAVDGTSGRVVIAGKEITTGTIYYYWTDDFITWNEISRTGTDVSGIAAIYPVGSAVGYEPPEGAIELPDAEGHYVDPVTGETSGPTTVIADTCPPITLQDIIDRLDARAGIPTANSITTELADIEVPGYAIDQFMTVAEAKEPLRQIYFFDCPEWDDAIRYRLRGQATDFTIDPDDLIEGEEATEQGTRGQAVEYPKRLHVQYVDPVTGYKPMKQTAERISPDIRVKGEMVTGANITISADTAKRAADIGLKTAWTEREDSREFAIPIDYWPQAIAAHTFTLDSRRYRITELRLEAGAIYIKSVYDRLSAYGSTATGTVGPSPTAPPSNIIGPTDFAVMNLPALRDADDSPGLYYAARGYTEGWTGARLQMVRNFLWNTVANITTACVMGELLAELPVADRDVIDTTNTISVRVSGTLDSVTFDDLLNESNVLAVLYPDYTAEILQFQTATEVSPGVYDLTTLIRGRLDTVIDTHAIGAQVVLLNSSVRFFELNTTELNQPTLQFRNVANGLAASTATTITLTNTELESVREWPVSDIEWERDGSDNLLVSWIGRARLGTDAFPAHSRFFTGYLVTITDGTTTRSWNTTLQSFVVSSANQVTIFGTDSFTPTITVTPTSTVTGGEVGDGAAFPAGLTGWTSDEAGWSEVAGEAVYDPTVSGVATSMLRYETPLAFPYSDPPATFYAACDTEGGNFSTGAVGYAYYSGANFIGLSGKGTLSHPHSTVSAVPKPRADGIAPAVYAFTNGTTPVSFSNLAYSVSE